MFRINGLFLGVRIDAVLQDRGKGKESRGKQSRSPRDAESDVTDCEVGRGCVVALRRAAVFDFVVPVAAAQQTVRTSLWSGGVCHAS